MEYIFVGEIVNTHGIKGELRIISDFKFKDVVFVPQMKLYIGKRKEELEIEKYRQHKNYDMVLFKGIDDINDAIAYKGDLVYINKNDIQIDGYFNEDIIGCDVYNKEQLIGQVDNIIKSNAHDILVIKNQKSSHLIPYIEEFIEKIDMENKKIYINVIEGLIDEN